MENQFSNSSSPYYFKRKIAAIIVFAIFFIMLGRHLTFLPTINLNEKISEEEFKESIEKITKKQKGFYSVYYKNLKNDEEFGINEDQIETGASINKLPIIAVLYYLENNGKINLDERITIQKEDVQDYGTGSIRYQKMPQTYSLRNLAKLALNQSDNTAAHVISVRIGEDIIQNQVDTWEMSQTDMNDNKTSAKDIGILLEMIYENKITNEAKTKELLSFMTDTQFEDRLAIGLSSEAILSHKTGDGEGFIHDGGIIRTKNDAYILCVFTSDIGENETETKKTIGEISEIIYTGLIK